MSIPVTVRCVAITDGERCDRMTSKTQYCAEHLRSELGLEVRESQIQGAGDGLWTVIPREKGNHICEYGGSIWINLPPDSDEEDEEEAHVGPYVMHWNENTVIDGARTDSVGRYINATRGTKLATNCQFVADRKNKKLWVRARTNIKAGKELFAGYGPGYWAAHRKWEKQMKEYEQQQ